MNYVLFNPKASGGNGREEAEKATKSVEKPVYENVIEISDMKERLGKLTENDRVYLVGGDGTLNHFANDVASFVPKCDIYYVKAGSGNDFFRDAKDDADKDGFIHLNRYLVDLPTVVVNGKSFRFLNGIGYGVDGETCRVGEIKRAKSKKPVNYTSIAIKLCLFSYKKNVASIKVDGKELDYRNVWLASTMKGRYYGGGMKVAPDQDRFNKDKSLSVVCLHKWSRLVTLIRFSSLFKGEHVKWADWCHIEHGKEVEVIFKYPCAIQIDGEVIPAVTSYKVKA